MTRYRSYHLTAMKIAASAGNTVVVNLDDVRCESVTTVPTGEMAGTDQIVFVGYAPGTPTNGPWLDLAPTALTAVEKARMFPVIPSKAPLNRAERRALRFKKGNR